MKTYTKTVLAVAALAVCSAAATTAQALPRSPILDSGSVSAIRGEVEQRYQAALAATLAPDVVRSEDTRYIWASEAKVACGIAIGFLKTNTVDEESINKCDDFYRRMIAPPPAPTLPPPPPTPPPCTVNLPILFYFGWDEDAAPAEADAVIANTVQSMQVCGWSGLTLAGHADKSGSDAYNVRLSERRVKNIADKLVAAGLPAGSIQTQAFGESMPAVQTEDGVREPLNRRVEVNAITAQ